MWTFFFIFYDEGIPVVLILQDLVPQECVKGGGWSRTQDLGKQNQALRGMSQRRGDLVHCEVYLFILYFTILIKSTLISPSFQVVIWRATQCVRIDRVSLQFYRSEPSKWAQAQVIPPEGLYCRDLLVKWTQSNQNAK